MVVSDNKFALQNATEALSRRICNKNGELLLIDVCMCLIIFCFSTLVLFGSFRRRSANRLLGLFLWATYTAAFTIISYTAGLMSRSTFKNDMFGVWGIIVLYWANSTVTITAYSLQDTEQEGKNQWDYMILFFILVGVVNFYINQESNFSFALSMLYFVCVFVPRQRLAALSAANRSGMMKNTKLVADFMSYEHELGNGEEVDPTVMKGYKYIVKGEEDNKKSKAKLCPPLYHFWLNVDDNRVITVEKIWNCRGRLLSNSGDPQGKLKDLCLSFALFKLLKRRFVGYPLYELELDKTWRFVHEGLLCREDDPERAFRVVQVELAFLYDFFYTGFAVALENGLPIWRAFTGALTALLSFWIVAKLHDHNQRSGNVNCVMPGGLNIDVLVTRIALGMLGGAQIWHFCAFFASDWFKVHLLCKYVRSPTLQSNAFYEKVVGFICSLKLLNHWEGKISQHSVLSLLPDINRMVFGPKSSGSIELSPVVKRAILRGLNSNGRRLTNGETSLRCHGVWEHLSWACRLETNTHSILVWHIATSLSEMDPTSRVGKREQDRHVAACLSKYCAYLVAFAPALVPTHAYDSKVIAEGVHAEAKKLMWFWSSTKKKYEMLMRMGEANETVLGAGAKLARELRRHIGEQQARWKLLAEFWVEMVLFIAPSNNAAAHAESLTTGGELLTHLWALLSHAGIVERDSAHGQL